jgi:hypothetical protein
MDNDEIKDLLYSANNGFSVENHNQAVVEAFRRGEFVRDAEIEGIKQRWEFALDKWAEANAKRNALMDENQRLKEELARMRQMRDDVLKEAKMAEAVIQQSKMENDATIANLKAAILQHIINAENLKAGLDARQAMLDKVIDAMKSLEHITEWAKLELSYAKIQDPRTDAKEWACQDAKAEVLEDLLKELNK